MDHASARRILAQVAPGVLGRAPNLAILQAAQAVALGESNYGAGWKADCAGSNNWGAVQAGKPPCGGDTCLYTDTHPNADGTSTPYEICFRRYPTPEAGAAHMLQILFTRKGARDAGVLDAAASGNLKAFSQAMYNSHYYEGFGATPEARVNNHYKMLRANVERIAKALNEPIADDQKRPSSKSSKGGGLFLLGAGLGALFLLRKG